MLNIKLILSKVYVPSFMLMLNMLAIYSILEGKLFPDNRVLYDRLKEQKHGLNPACGHYYPENVDVYISELSTIYSGCLTIIKSSQSLHHNTLYAYIF